MAGSSLHGCCGLIVEDEHLIAMSLSDHLQALGSTIIGPAPSVEEAIRLIESNPKIDVAILDINLLRAKGLPNRRFAPSARYSIRLRLRIRGEGYSTSLSPDQKLSETVCSWARGTAFGPRYSARDRAIRKALAKLEPKAMPRQPRSVRGLAMKKRLPVGEGLDQQDFRSRLLLQSLVSYQRRRLRRR
jgi:hypothetical protein